MSKFKVGDRVRLAAGKSHKAARIVSFVEDIEGGVKLDDYLDGFRYWNVADLVKANPWGGKQPVIVRSNR